MSYVDFTLKAVVDSQPIIEKKLQDIGANFIAEDFQHDFYFKVPKGKLKYRKSTIRSLITHYERIKIGEIEKTRVFRYDLNPSNREIDLLFETSELIGEIKKTRKIFQFKNSTIHLDLPVTGGIFLEIETKGFDGSISENELQVEAKQIFHRIGIVPDQLVVTGYL